MLRLSARSGALAAGLGVVVALISPLGPIAYADGTTTPPATDVPATDVPPTTDPTVVPPVTTPVAKVPAVATRHARPYPTLRLGSHGKRVLMLERGIGIKRADHYFDRGTKKRVQSIQRWGRVPRTGVVDLRTARVIHKWVKFRHHQKYAASHRLSLRLARIIAFAREYRGRPYVYGAAGPRAFDCSGYTRYVVGKALGRSLPHIASSQASSVKRITRSQARPGDLVFFHGGGGIYHVGIYAGGNRLWHASRPGTRTGLGPIFSSSVTFGRVA